MQFSIYDHKNMFLAGTESPGAESNKLYVGTTAKEVEYQYMKPGPAGKEYPAGGDVSVPYTAEFRITETTVTAGTDGAPDKLNPAVLTVLGAPAVTDEAGKPLFNTDGTPKTPASFTVVGQLTIPEPDAEEPVAYRVAVSSNKYKWFKAKAEGAKAAAHLVRG
jgi:hypothetical protein